MEGPNPRAYPQFCLAGGHFRSRAAHTARRRADRLPSLRRLPPPPSLRRISRPASLPPFLPDPKPSAPPKCRRGKHPVAVPIAGFVAPPAPSAARPRAPRPTSGGGLAATATRSEAAILKQARPTARGWATMSTPSQNKACGSKKVSSTNATHLSHAHMQNPP